MRDVVLKGPWRAKKQRTREAREDAVDLAVDDELRVVTDGLRAPRLSVS